MIDFLTFIKEYWFILVFIVAFIAVVSIKIYNWFKQPTSEQMQQIQEWLLYAVAKAEEALGSGTGQLKLRYVYDMFVTKFPAIAIFISFDTFAKMVDKALDEFNELLIKNKNLAEMYTWKFPQIEDTIQEEKEDKDV